MIKLNGIQIEPTLFPDRTSQIWHLPDEVFQEPFALIEWWFDLEAELIHLAQLKDLLDTKNIKSNLRIWYLPYGRQDKDISNTATFALHTFSKILNLLNFNQVSIFDPHSKKAVELINKSTDSYPTNEITYLSQLLLTDVFCYPDMGATVKYSQIYDRYASVYGEKVRDQATGRITSYSLHGNVSSKKVLIVDDICDGGATFVLLTKALLEQGATEVYLFVTHGIFSKGLKPLREAGIKRVFTSRGEVISHQGDVAYKNVYR